jgi:hypothetical protein
MSHLIEHLSRDEGRQLLKECHRALRAEGVIRVVVPDLEDIAKNYIAQLNAARSAGPSCGQSETAAYDFAAFELLDQLVRTSPGGELSKTISGFMRNIPHIVKERLGEEFARELVGSVNRECPELSGAKRIISGLLWRCRTFVKAIAMRMPLCSSLMNRWNVAAYLQAGERHKWMYDEFSLSQLLLQCGFTSLKRQTCHSSYIMGWSSLPLDVSSTGAPYKPHSIYMEAKAAK